jgi:hypothetical protein
MIARQLPLLLPCGAAENYIRDTFYAHLCLKGIGGVRRDYKSIKAHTQKGKVDVAMELGSQTPTFIEFKQLYLDFPKYNDCLDNPFRDIKSLGDQNAHRFAIVLARLLTKTTPLCIHEDQVYKLARELKYGPCAFDLLDELFRKRAMEIGGSVYPDSRDRRVFRVFSEHQDEPSIELYAWVIRVDKV